MGMATGFAGGMAAGYQMERGEQALSQYNDPVQMFLDAGFPKRAIWSGKYEQRDKTISWFVSCARKP